MHAQNAVTWLPEPDARPAAAALRGVQVQGGTSYGE